MAALVIDEPQPSRGSADRVSNPIDEGLEYLLRVDRARDCLGDSEQPLSAFRRRCPEALVPFPLHRVPSRA